MRVRDILAVACAVLAFSAMGASFQFAVAPTHVDKGGQEPGTQFYGEFRVFASEETTIGINIERGSLETFRRFRPSSADRFSAATCTDCVELLKGEGTLEEQGETVTVGGSEFSRWKDVRFLLDVPEDMEPGYHLVEITPAPDVSGSRSSVSVVSASSFPVIFEVPGRAVRSGQVIGVRAEKARNDERKIVGTFHNNGTVSMEVKMRFDVESGNGTTVVGTGKRLVPPGESSEFAVFVPDEGEENFAANVTADYATGAVTTRTSLTATERATPRQQVEQERVEPPFSTIVLLFILAITTFGLWKVMRRG